MLDTKMFSLGFLLVALAHQALARVNQVEVGVNIVVVSHSHSLLHGKVKLYGDITSSLDALASGLKSIEAGRKVSFPVFFEKKMALLLLITLAIVNREICLYLDGKIFFCYLI